MQKFTMNIGGQRYTIRTGTREELDIESDAQAETHFYKHTISVCDDLEAFGDSAPKVMRETVIHELTHALLHECGFVRLADGEAVEEWLSVCLDKMNALVAEFDKKYTKE